MKHIKSFIIILITLFISLGAVPPAFANTTAISSALTYLQNQQASTGQINGWGGESDWAAIAFSKNGLSPSVVKSGDTSLYDFLLSDLPASDSAATVWERKIIAIVSLNHDPADFGGHDYLSSLELFALNGQLGDETLLNDDIFGLLALLSTSSANNELIESVLDFLITHQDPSGGFSWTTNICDWCSPDSNDTAAAIQALHLAKTSGYTHPQLEDSLSLAQAYLLESQTESGGFAYDPNTTTPDGASTSWALMALNILGLSDSPQALHARDWLLSQQQADGGFPWSAEYGSDPTTTSHALVALNSAWWTKQTPNPSLTPTSTPTQTPTPTPTTPEPTTTSTPTPTSSPTPTTSITPTTQPLLLGSKDSKAPLPIPSLTDQQQKDPDQTLVTDDNKGLKSPSASTSTSYIPTLAFILSIISLFAVIKIYELKKND